MSVAVDRKLNRKRSEFFNVAWARCEAFLRVAQPAYRAHSHGQITMTMPGLLGPAFRERLSAAMRIPVVEALSSEPWTAAARRVLPSPSPQMTATAMWAPIIAWCALETLAESIGPDQPEAAPELFERLRLRKPLAESLNHLGFEGEAGWRAAARIKVLLLAEAKGLAAAEAKKAEPKVETKPATSGVHPSEIEAHLSETSSMRQGTASVRQPIVGGLPRKLWSDPDVRWLTGAHDAGNYTYLVLEPYEELLWWLQIPNLLRIAGSPAPARAEVLAMNSKVRAAQAEAKKAGYRLQALLGADEPKKASHKDSVEAAKPEPSAASAGATNAVEAKESEEKPV